MFLLNYISDSHSDVVYLKGPQPLAEIMESPLLEDVHSIV